MMKRFLFMASILLSFGLTTVWCRATDYYVAPAGDDAHLGTLEQPFATIRRAQQAAAPGDTVLIRGGTYRLREEQIAKKQKIWAYVTCLDKSGKPDQPIRYWAFGDERPVFDFSLVKPADCRITAFYVTASWVHLKGLEVTGVQVTLTNHTQSICFDNEGSHNIYERLSMHDGMAIGIYSVKGSGNLFLNCDAYRNYDSVSEDGRGGNVDGFGCHPTKGSTNNVLRGCRAWFNSDDGFDCINSFESVTFDNCWAFFNGYSPEFKSLGDGNGFKTGGYGTSPVNRLPRPIPRHTVRFSLAVRNKSSGFYSNHHIGGSDWVSNTAYRNGINFNMLCRLDDNRTDVPGYGHKLRNNLAYNSRGDVRSLDTAKSDSRSNSFDSERSLSDADFVSLDDSQLTAPRQPDGNLPAMTFLHLSSKSGLIDAGADAGLPFRGKAPDLGAFESERP